MGRAYSGNIIANNAAVQAIREAGFVVLYTHHYDDIARQQVIELTVETLSGSPIAHERFRHYDEDVLLNESTGWLNKLATDLSSWR